MTVRTVAFLGLLAWSAPTHAQGPTPITLQGGVPLAETFSSVRGLVELPDGVLLIHDADEKRIVRLDPRTGSVTPAARLGSGPLEFQAAGALVPDARGGAIFVDMRQQRLLRFNAAGQPTGTMSLGTDPLDAASITRIFSVDRSGRLYAMGSPMRIPDLTKPSTGENLFNDSIPVIRVSADGVRRDTVAWTTSDAQGSRTTMTPTALRTTLVLPDGRPRTQLVVLSDGSIASLEPPEYRLRVRTPDGRRTVGPLVPFTPIPLTVAAREKGLADARRGIDSALAESRRMRQRMAAEIPPGVPMPTIPQVEMSVEAPKSWSATLEPWSLMRVSSTDLVLVTVPREYMGGAAHTDVLARDGRLLARLRAPKGEGIEAVGAKGIYTRRTDEDELITITVYPLPAALKR